jgi:hypothetical protein
VRTSLPFTTRHNHTSTAPPHSAARSSSSAQPWVCRLSINHLHLAISNRLAVVGGRVKRFVSGGAWVGGWVDEWVDHEPHKDLRAWVCTHHNNSFLAWTLSHLT